MQFLIMKMTRFFAYLTIFPLFLFCVMLTGSDAAIAQGAAPMETPAKQAIIVDASTGTTLFEKDADQRMPTSSMSKVMTMYMVFEALQDGRLTLDQTLPVSEKAWRKRGSKMFVEVGKEVAVEDLIRGVIVQSGNDATIVFAEALAGTEEAFARQMTERAHQLGMRNSNFMNASGWPDPEHYSTARDLALMAYRMVNDFPQFYRFYSELEFTFAGIRQYNRNPLLRLGLADGIKTGHTEAGGYGLIASDERDGRRLIMVVNGLNSESQRRSESQRLLNWGFTAFDSYKFFDAGEALTDVPVWLGAETTVRAVIPETVRMTLERRVKRNLTFTLRFDSPVAAPVKKGQKLGDVIISGDFFNETRYPLIAESDIAQLGTVDRMIAAAKYLVFGAQAQTTER